MYLNINYTSQNTEKLSSLYSTIYPLFKFSIYKLWSGQCALKEVAFLSNYELNIISSRA